MADPTMSSKILEVDKGVSSEVSLATAKSQAGLINCLESWKNATY